MITYAEMAKIMEQTFAECVILREKAHKEYAHNDNALENFERIAKDLDVDRMKVLSIYAKKHWDGIIAYIKGYRSQREHVSGRVNDLIVYLCLLKGMVVDNENFDRIADSANARQNEIERGIRMGGQVNYIPGNINKGPHEQA